MGKKGLLVLTLGGVAVIVLGTVLLRSSSWYLDHQIAEAAAAASTAAPKMMEDGVRFDGADAMPGSVLQYNYTFVGASGALKAVGMGLAKDEVRDNLKDRICTDATLAPLLARGVTFRYRYTLSDSGLLSVIEIPPAACHPSAS